MPNRYPQNPPPWAPMIGTPPYNGGPAPGYGANPNVLPIPRVPQAVPQEGVFLPPGSGSPEAPGMPYGMGDCRTFLDIPPLVHFSDGSTCINPDYDALHKFSLSAVGRDVAFPERSLVPDPVVGVDDTVNFQLTVEREENGMGHFLIEELLMLTDPDTEIDGMLVEIKSLQGDRFYTNAPTPALNIFGNAQLSCCLPCPIMLYPNQTLVFSVNNVTAAPVTVRIVARGRRFMPYHNMGLVQEMERCWSMIQTFPYWLSFDAPVSIPTAAAGPPIVPGQVQGQMSVPGGGYFQMIRPLVQVVSDTPGVVSAEDILIEVTDGRIGKRFMDGPINLGAHWATPTIEVAGFPGGFYRAASASHCPPPSQLIRGNTRLIHDMQNSAVGSGASVRITYVGCYHYADMCPPQADLDLVRRYGSEDARALKQAQEAGDRVYLGFLDENPLYVDQLEDCQAPSAQACVEEDTYFEPEPEAVAPPPAPEPPRIVTMHRPSKQFFGPGSAGALPDHMSWGVDQHGKTHLVIRNKVNQFVRFATARETAGFQGWLNQINAAAGVSGMHGLGRRERVPGRAGLGAHGEWEAI